MLKDNICFRFNNKVKHITNIAGHLHTDSRITDTFSTTLSMGMTGNDYDVMYNATLMTAKFALGVGCLRPECCVEITNSL